MPQFPEISVKNTGRVWWGKQAGPGGHVLCVPSSPPGPANTGFQTFALPSPCQLASSPLKSQTTAPASSFGFSRAWNLMWRFGPLWELLGFWGSLPGRHVIKLWFSPVHLSYVNLIIRPAKEPKREEGKFFLPLHKKPSGYHFISHVASQRKLMLGWLTRIF